MITFTDGPAEGSKLQLRRTPVFLRVVTAELADVDALDQPDDKPEPHENVFVYLMAENNGGYFLDYTNSKTGKRGGHFQPSAVYSLYDPQPPDVIARDNRTWKVWCKYQPEPEIMKR